MKLFKISHKKDKYSIQPSQEKVVDEIRMQANQAAPRNVLRILKEDYEFIRCTTHVRFTRPFSGQSSRSTGISTSQWMRATMWPSAEDPAQVSQHSSNILACAR